MTPTVMLACVMVFSDLSAERNKKFNQETHRAIAQNICASANKNDIEPKLLAAYILTENSRFDPFSAQPAAQGEDKGLYQSNSHFHGDKANFALVNHPYYATDIAAQIIRENFKRFGNTWKAIAAYWNPRKAREESPDAIRYYERWLMNYQTVNAMFAKAEKANYSRNDND